jgi:uncharacterized protein YmfQ (DUF2313 family)
MGAFFAPGQGYPGQATLTRAAALTDLGLTVTDSLQLRRPRSTADTALTVSDSPFARKIQGRATADAGLVVSDSLVFHHSFAIRPIDRGLALTDTVGVLTGHTLPPAPPAPDVVPTAKLEAMLGDLQPELTEDPIITSTLRALASELQRIDDAADQIRRGFFPGWTNDSYRLLSLWEQFFGLPVAASAMTLEQRREFVEAHFRKRLAGAGYDWENALTKAMGTTHYVYHEGPAPYFVNITYPFASGAPNSAIVQGLAREITPAHLALGIGYTQGFLVGISLIGDLL